MENNIKNLWSQIQDKQKAILELSQLTKVKPISIYTNWLCDSKFWSVPDKHLKETINLFQNIIKSQKK